jgi:hypothetical protein
LDINQIYELNVALEVGAASEKVVVVANPVQVESNSMQLGTTITAQQIEDIPLNGRDWTELMELSNGTIGSSDRFSREGGQGNSGAYSTNGNQSQQNSFLINGVDSNSIDKNTAALVPSPDAMAEFRLITNTINPEYGRNSGAVVNAEYKSGTNQFRGDVFEFYRDTFLNAKPWFYSAPPKYHQNQFGGTLGGPIVKDHTFFFFSYQGLQSIQPQGPTESGTLSLAERGGNFSDAGPYYGPYYPEPSGSPCGPNYTGSFGPNPLPFAIGSAAAGTPFCVAFPTGQVPTTSFNSLATKLMNQYIPLPTPGAPGGNLYYFNPTFTQSGNEYILRLDEKLREKEGLWFTAYREPLAVVKTLPSGISLPGQPESDGVDNQAYTVAWNHTFSPHTLNEVRLAYLRVNGQYLVPENPITPASYGFTGITPQYPSVAGLPDLYLGPFSLGFTYNGPQPYIQNTYQATDNFTKVVGSHNFKAGFNMDLLQVNSFVISQANGDYCYVCGGPYDPGTAAAAFLLGIPDTYAQQSGGYIRARAKEIYSFFQDEWRITHNLTLTYGTGWDIEVPWENLSDGGLHSAAWRPGQQSTIFPKAPVGLVYPGDAGINKYGGQQIPYKTFAPRAGFAWSPMKNWSIHGGIGLYYNRTEEELAFFTLAAPPFTLASRGASVECGTSPAFANPYADVTGKCAPVANPFPFVPPTGGGNVTFSQFEPLSDTGFTVWDPKFTLPRASNYNLTIEHQISGSTIVSLGYVGNVGRHEVGVYLQNLAGTAPGINPVAASYPNCTSGFVLAYSSCPAFGTPGGTPYNLNVYGQFGSITSGLSSNYNSLQAKFDRHFSNGLQLTAAYTWSRYFEYATGFESSFVGVGTGLNTFDLKSNYGPSLEDAPQRLVVNYNYMMPFYKLIHHWKSATDGWRLTGIYTLQHGLPAPVFNYDEPSLTCDGNVSPRFICPDRANRTSAPLAIHNPRTYSINGLPNYWFSPAAFSSPAPGTGIGNANRNPVYGPGLNYGDTALEKEVHFGETMYVQLRLETFNTFNHANFSNPYGDVAPYDSNYFGRIFTTTLPGRVTQLGGKLYF